MKDVLINIVIVVYVAIWVYLSFMKFINFAKFKLVLSRQVFPRWLKSVILLTLPFVELIIVFLLLFEETQFEGICMSFVVFLSRSIYVAFLARYPYFSCDIFKNVSWIGQLKVNLFFMAVALLGVALLLS